MSSLKVVALIPDIHFPNHDEKAVALVHKVLKAVKPQELVLLGDVGDFESVMSHQKNKRQRELLLKDDVEATRAGLAEFEAHDIDTKVFVMGNHEDRVARYITNQAPELFGAVSLPRLLRLREHGWKVVQYRKHYKLGKINVTHDVGKAGANAHRDALIRFSDNVVIGHTHRMAYEVRGNLSGGAHVGAMFGWLGDWKKAAGYMYAASAMSDWSLGFGMGYEQKSGVVHIQPVPIIVAKKRYSCVVGGTLFEI